MEYATLYLKKNEDRRLRAGHVWVFSNEVDIARSPLTVFQPGQPVRVLAHSGRPLGTGYVNPRSLISVRLVSTNPAAPHSPALIHERLQSALRLRERFYTEPYYRLAHAESDGLPGLIIDRYGEILVVQINTAGMEVMRATIIDSLRELLQPTGILLRNDGASRALEGLPGEIEAAHGEVPAVLTIIENSCRFKVAMREGQKTGWFYDHRANRARLPDYVKGRRVLDVFSYLGGWGIQAAAAGAAQVHCVEASATAAEFIRDNAALNNIGEALTVDVEDAFTALKNLRESNKRFDVVILDPPAFVKRKKDTEQGMEAYQRLNTLAMQVLNEDGIVISASCSSHVTAADFRNVVRQAGLKAHCTLRILEQGHQALDHPIHPAIPETEYLKTLFLYASSS
ncbi:MAG TPA: class I SAM-dependent rRNA methyltransferase [Gammaproteobacteria bacterium]|nr:class I SAM-dependent rRNA methyltransferase [Gammaproteobacteria bacterium]